MSTLHLGRTPSLQSLIKSVSQVVPINTLRSSLSTSMELLPSYLEELQEPQLHLQPTHTLPLARSLE